MGIQNGVDTAARQSGGAISSVAAGPGQPAQGPFNVSVWGTFVATWSIERSFDGGTTWLNVSLNGSGSANSFTAGTTLTFSEPESGVQYRVHVTAWTSGTVNWRISQ